MQLNLVVHTFRAEYNKLTAGVEFHDIGGIGEASLSSGHVRDLGCSRRGVPSNTIL